MVKFLNKSGFVSLSLIFTILFPFGFGEASSVYFPSLLKKNFSQKIAPCVGEALPKFSFREDDWEPGNVKSVFLRMNQRASLEGKARKKSVVCLRKKEFTPSEKEELKVALESMFRQEKELFFLYTRFLDNAVGINRTKNAVFLKSRYDLMVILQTKTSDWVLAFPDEDDSGLEKEFSNLYLSILRTHYDFLVELNPTARLQYLRAKEGKK